MAQSSSTGPSHLSILTGQHVQRHGLLKNGYRSSPIATLASTLKDAGYSTAAFTGHGSLQAKFGHGVGFDVFLSWPPGSKPSPTFQRHLHQTIPEGLTWIDELAEEPFFLFLHGYDPHLPFWPEEPWRTDYAGWYEGDLDISQLHKRTHFHPLIEDGRLGEEEIRYLKDLYDGEIASSDQVLGGLFDALDERGLLDRSVIVFTSDHGEVIGDHDWVGHGVFWQEVMQVPLIVRLPGGAHAGRIQAPAQHVDILPTVLSAVGLPAPAGVQGVDFMPLITGTARAVEPRLRVARWGPQVAVRFDDEPNLKIKFKVLADSPEPELYDLAADPNELNNLYEENTAKFMELYGRYKRWNRQESQQDDLFQGEAMPIQSEDLEMLRALGYVGDDEDPTTDDG